jgi:uncharacterized membrane protein
MRKALVLTALCAALLAFATSAAAANHTTVTETENIHGVFTEPEFAQNPCNGAAITSFQAYGNIVHHQTSFLENGEVTEVWATFTETGKVAITDASGVTYDGHFTVWGNYNLNERNTNETFTLTIRVSGSDGSAISAHEVEHFGTNANGDVTATFDNMSLTCG